MKFFNTRSIHYGILAVSSVISAIATTTYAGVALVQYEHAEQSHVQASVATEVDVATAIPDDIIDFDKAVSIARGYAQGKVLEAVLSQQHGKLFYVVDFSDHGKVNVVWVDALNGAIREI